MNEFRITYYQFARLKKPKTWWQNRSRKAKENQDHLHQENNKVQKQEKLGCVCLFMRPALKQANSKSNSISESTTNKASQAKLNSKHCNPSCLGFLLFVGCTNNFL